MVILLVFSFESIRIDEKKQLCDCVPYHISYYLEDGTISVKEHKHKDESFDFCPYLIKRVKVPKYSKRLINSLIVAEGDGIAEQKDEIDYIEPSDFMVGKEVNLLGHRFLIRDCDARTRTYYEEILKIQQGETVMIEKIRPIKLKNVSFCSPLNFHFNCLIFKLICMSLQCFNSIYFLISAHFMNILGCSEIHRFWYA